MTTSRERVGLGALDALGPDFALSQLPAEVRAAFLDAVLAAVDDSVVISRADNLSGTWCPTVLHVNAGFTRLTGYTPEEACGALPGMWAPLERNRQAHERVCGALERGEPAQAEISVQTRSGEERRMDSTVSPICKEHGKWYFVEVARDVTERARLVTQLAEREEQLREAQALAHLGSWDWDVTTGAVAWSDELYRIYQLDPANFSPSYDAYLDRLHPDDRSFAMGNIERALGTREPFGADYRIVLPDGQVRWLHTRGRALVDENNRVARLVGTCQDITDQKAAEEALRHQALHDGLTGLPNRALLADRLEHAVSRSQRHGQATVVLFIDLDYFKSINDRYGHAVGDEVLKEVAASLREALRPGDTIARVGGDEFVAVCEELADGDADIVAERVLTAIRDVTVAEVDRLSVTGSVGITTSDGSQPPDVVLRNADAAMYQAKHAGRDRSVLQVP